MKTETKKIGVITLVDYLNYGNRLQNFALREFLKNMNYKVETLVIKNLYQNDYKKSIQLKDKIKKIVKMKPSLIVEKLYKKLIFITIDQEYVKMKSDRFKQFSSTFLRERFYFNTPDDLHFISNYYDFLISGSDQVWNPEFDLKQSGIYFLTPFPKNKRIVYAPSFGISKLPEEYKENYKKWISEISYLSVREKSGVEIIETLIGKKVPTLVDPVLLLTKEEWLKFSKVPSDKPKSKYLLTYFIGKVSEQRKSLIHEIAKKYNLQIVSLMDLEDKKAFTADPLEFIYYFSSATMILTDSFHGTAFSILFEIPFVVFKNIGRESVHSRIDNILDMFKFKNRFEDNIDFSKNLFDIDFTHVKDILDKERERSTVFLKNALTSEVKENKNNKIAFEEIGKANCAGCFLCANVCPFDAIEMKLDENGFYFPEINQKRCTRCGICYNKCPVINNENCNNKTPKAYAAYSKDEAILKDSSSGGLFSELAKKIIQENGVVYGVTWDYSNISVKHIRIETLKDLPKLRKSKYLQSYVGNTYKKVKEDINQSRKVLFVGTPCQVTAVNNMINSNNLYTVDVICTGIPSLKAFRKYLEENFKFPINSIDFRNKKKGWKNFFVKIQNFSQPVSKNPFFQGFSGNLYLNDICYKCPFARIPRAGDITLGDYWGVPKKFDNGNKGVSAVLINNKKGGKLFYSLANVEFFNADLENIKKRNFRLYDGYHKNFELKEKVVKDLNKNGFNYVRKKYFKEQLFIIVIFRKALSKVKHMVKIILKKVLSKQMDDKI